MHNFEQNKLSYLADQQHKRYVEHLIFTYQKSALAYKQQIFDLVKPFADWSLYFSHTTKPEGYDQAYSNYRRLLNNLEKILVRVKLLKEIDPSALNKKVKQINAKFFTLEREIFFLIVSK